MRVCGRGCQGRGLGESSEGDNKKKNRRKDCPRNDNRDGKSPCTIYWEAGNMFRGSFQFVRGSFVAHRRRPRNGFGSLEIANRPVRGQLYPPVPPPHFARRLTA